MAGEGVRAVDLDAAEGVAGEAESGEEQAGLVDGFEMAGALHPDGQFDVALGEDQDPAQSATARQLTADLAQVDQAGGGDGPAGAEPHDHVVPGHLLMIRRHPVEVQRSAVGEAAHRAEHEGDQRTAEADGRADPDRQWRGHDR